MNSRARSFLGKHLQKNRQLARHHDPSRNIALSTRGALALITIHKIRDSFQTFSMRSKISSVVATRVGDCPIHSGPCNTF